VQLPGKPLRNFWLWASLAALALRLFFLWRFPAVIDDSRLYANIAENWMRHGIYGVTNSGVIMPTLSRLPGYPAFLAAIFSLLGIGNFRAVLLVQVLFDLATCWLIADIARKLCGERAAKAAFLLAGLCPFLANYAATVLTETLEIFFTALAFNFVIRGLTGTGRTNLNWVGCGLSIGGATLLRPDGGILLIVIGGYLIWLLIRDLTEVGGNSRFWQRRQEVGRPLETRGPSILQAGIIVGICSLAPLAPWTIRNLHTLHRFQPLAPRYANDSDEPVMAGFNRWVKTWMAEYVSVEEIYWNVPGQEIDASKLPNRAFDSSEQREQTGSLIADYNRDHDITPELDARFAELAAQRIHAAPIRYYGWLPALRIVDMWLRPRSELFPSDPRWWEFNDDRRWLAVSLGFGVLNLAYVGMAFAGWWRARKVTGVGLLVAFVVIRSLFLGTLENPEPRYTLECFPVVCVLAAAVLRKK
jgi:hypothetical protein